MQVGGSVFDICYGYRPGIQAGPYHQAASVCALQAEDLVGAVAAYAKLFARCRALNVGHPQLYVCHANRAAAYLRLRLYDEALLDAERCRALAQASFKK